MTLLVLSGVALAVVVAACTGCVSSSLRSLMISLLTLFFGIAIVLACIGMSFVASLVGLLGSSTALAVGTLGVSISGFEPRTSSSNRHRVQAVFGLSALVLAAVFTATVVFAFAGATPVAGTISDVPTASIGQGLLGSQALVFALASVVLMAAVVASVELARGDR